MSQPQAKAWIPPAALVWAQIAHGLSWLVLLVNRWPSTPGLSMPALSWIHLVALGWLTLTALGILVHVIPGFLDVDWVAEGVARWSLLPFGIGVACLVAGFAFVLPWALAIGSSLIALGLIGYLVPAFLTLLRFRPSPDVSAPLKQGFQMVLLALVLTAALGVTMAWALSGAPWGGVLAYLPPIHAVLGGAGWLSLLVFGVSTRTVFPVTGRRRHTLPLHRYASAGFTMGTVVLALGLIPGIAHPAVRGLGIALLAIAAVCYVTDMAKLVYQAPNDHKPPIAFVASTLVYLIATVALGVLVTLGHAEWQPALAFVGLAGWLGQSVNAYTHHIGIRLLATVARGDEDETRPGELLVPALSWLCFASLQTAVAGGTVVLMLGHGEWLPLFGGIGVFGWLCLMTNVITAWRNAKRLPPLTSIPEPIIPLG